MVEQLVSRVKENSSLEIDRSFIHYNEHSACASDDDSDAPEDHHLSRIKYEKLSPLVLERFFGVTDIPVPTASPGDTAIGSSETSSTDYPMPFSTTCMGELTEQA